MKNKYRKLLSFIIIFTFLFSQVNILKINAEEYEHSYVSEKTYNCSYKNNQFSVEVFQPIDNIKEELVAISFFSPRRNQTYGIYIEPDHEKNTFNGYYSGQLKKLKTVTFQESGVNTVKLDTKVELLDGKKFALIVVEEGPNKSTISNISKKGEAERARVYTKNKRYTPVSKISLDKTELNLRTGENFKLEPIITPYNATNDKVKWTSSDEKVATVSEDGTVTGVDVGETIVKATSVEGDFEAQCKVVVGVDLNLVSLTPKDGSFINPNGEIRVKFDYKLKSFNPEKIYIYDENHVYVQRDVYIDNDTLVIKTRSSKNNSGKYIAYIDYNAVTSVFNRNLKQKVEFEYILEPIKVNNIKFKDKVLEDAIKKQLNVQNRNLSTDDMKKLTELTISEDTIYSLEGIQYAINLKKLNIKKSNIISLRPLSKLYLLEELSIESSKIKDIDFIEDLTNLKTLTLKNGYIENIKTIGSLRRLSYLDLSGNKIRRLDSIRGLYGLKHLDLHNNLIEDVFNLGDLRKIQVCNLNNNLINKISPVKSMVLNRDKNDRASVELHIDNNLIDLQNNFYNYFACEWLKKNVNSCKDFDFEVESNRLTLMNYKKFTLDKKCILQNNESIVLEFAKDIELVNKKLITLTNEAKQNIDIDISCSENKLIIIPKSKYTLGASYKLNLNKGAINSIFIDEDSRFNNDKTEEELYIKVPFEKHIIDFEVTNNIKGDINKDGKIDIKELANIAQAYGQEVDSTENWDFNTDVNEDGIVDLYDISHVAKLIK